MVVGAWFDKEGVVLSPPHVPNASSQDRRLVIVDHLSANSQKSTALGSGLQGLCPQGGLSSYSESPDSPGETLS